MPVLKTIVDYLLHCFAKSLQRWPLILGMVRIKILHDSLPIRQAGVTALEVLLTHDTVRRRGCKQVGLLGPAELKKQTRGGRTS